MNQKATIEKFMDNVLAPHNAYVMCSIDDIIVFSDNFDSHVKYFEAVVDVLFRFGNEIFPG